MPSAADQAHRTPQTARQAPAYALAQRSPPARRTVTPWLRAPTGPTWWRSTVRSATPPMRMVRQGRAPPRDMFIATGRGRRGAQRPSLRPVRLDVRGLLQPRNDPPPAWPPSPRPITGLSGSHVVGRGLGHPTRPSKTWPRRRAVHGATACHTQHRARSCGRWPTARVATRGPPAARIPSEPQRGAFLVGAVRSGPDDAKETPDRAGAAPPTLWLA